MFKPDAHSSKSIQVFPSKKNPISHDGAHVSLPSPMKPFLHAQVKPPSLFVQVASTWQLFKPDAHSSKSTQVVPSKKYPVSHDGGGHVSLPSPMKPF